MRSGDDPLHYLASALGLLNRCGRQAFRIAVLGTASIHDRQADRDPRWPNTYSGKVDGVDDRTLMNNWHIRREKIEALSLIVI